MACKITKGIFGRGCSYLEAGLALVWLANWYPMVKLVGTTIPVSPGEVPVAGQIGYRLGPDGDIISIVLPPTEKFYPLFAGDFTMSYADQLLAGANGAKYRQHQLNAVLMQDDIDLQAQVDGLSLGKFIAVVQSSAGTTKVLGRTAGIQAAANGMDFASGAAAADAMGWTLILQGPSMEAAPLVEPGTVLTPIDTAVVTP